MATLKEYIHELLSPILQSLTGEAEKEQSTRKSTDRAQPKNRKKKNTSTNNADEAGSTSTLSNTPTNFPPLPPTQRDTSKPSTSRVPNPTGNNPTQEETIEESTPNETEWSLTREARKKLRKQQKKEEKQQTQNQAKKRLPKVSKKDPATVLLLPNQENPIVLQKLQNLPEANPRKLGIRRHIQFPSGAVLVTCGDPERAEELRRVAEKAGIQEKKVITKNPEFRIHSIPAYTTPEELTEDIQRRFTIQPLDIKLLPYTSEKRKSQLYAVVICNLELYKQAQKTRNIRIGWNICHIDCSPHVRRCTNCLLLGHSEKKCTQMTPTASVSAEANTEPVCRDCTHHNAQQSRATETTHVKTRPRPTNHNTGSKQCPTLLSFQKKSLPTLMKAVPNRNP